MSRHPLMDDLRPFIGKPMLTSIEEIIRIATVHNFRVNIIDPQFNPSSIDEEPDRINVLSNRHGNICMFTIG
jgi:hypothetical protein